ncbi:hypothetical protein IFR05_010236 [Cadophora sp. M221]|nr:hypothetical protein IFR05_010236 [Cadophora sp. M221]
MTQSAGMVCFLPSTFSSTLRSSPLICIIDTLILLEQLIWHTILLRSPLKAAKLITEFRFQDVENNKPGGLSDLKTNTPFRIMLFLFGALPQLIKLFSMTGLPWTQVAGGAYIASFAIIELLNLLAWMASPPAQRHIPRGTTAPEEFIGLLSVAHSILFAFYIFTHGFISASTLYLPKFHRCSLLILVLLVIYLSSTTLRPRPRHTNTNTNTAARKAILYLLLCTSFLSSIFLGIAASSLVPTMHVLSHTLPRNFSPEIAMNITPILTTYASFIIVAFSTFKVYRDVAAAENLNEDANEIGNEIETARKVLIEMVSPWLYLVLHVVSLAMVYAFAYDSEGTRKPLWAELLG